MNIGKKKKGLNEEVVSVKSKTDNQEYALNWRGKVIPAEKALSESEKLERKQLIIKMIKVASMVILIMLTLWFFISGIPMIIVGVA